MIEGLAAAIEEAGDRAIPELERALGDVLPEPTRLVRLITLKRGVHRVVVESRGAERSVVVKRLAPEKARRSELASVRWLPAAGLGRACPALLARAAEREGAFLWHVYEDLGDRALATDPPDWAQVEAVVRLIAMLHSRFVEHPLLTEARWAGGDMGFAFFTSNLSDARYALSALRARPCRPEREALRERLLARVDDLVATAPMRAEVFRLHAGPETLLHGDLWTTNAVVPAGARGPCLVDWDHAGVGPASYDVSTFLLRFPREHRASIFRSYVDALGARGWRPPGKPELDVLFETAELARYSNTLCWTALALADGEPEWAWDGLREVERWFEALGPMFPPAGEVAVGAPA
jgi:fructosamine-3-kinase